MSLPSNVSANAPDRDTNPFAFLKPAASGDVEALRVLSSMALAQGACDGDIVAMSEALLLGRLTYAASGNPGDAGTLISMLAVACKTYPNDDDANTTWMGEVVALTSKLADEGHPIAESNFPALVDACGRDAVQLAHSISKLMEEVN